MKIQQPKFILSRKQILLHIAFLFVAFSITAQQQTKLNFALVKKIQSSYKQNEPVDVLVKGTIDEIKKQTITLGGKFKFAAGNIASIEIPLQAVNILANNKAIQRIEGRFERMVPLNDTMLVKNAVIQVHDGQAPLLQGYDGTGVVVGLIDTGIDFRHPDFQDSTGKSRIKYLWDQKKILTTNAPQPYGYGQEWNNLQIDSGLANAHTDTLEYGHGTRSAGTAAGNGNALLLDTVLLDSLISNGLVSAGFRDFKGIATNADIIFVANNRSDRIPDAVNYIFTKAKEMGKPCVINISLGDYYGSHDGLDLQTQVIDSLITVQNGRVVVASAGNSGNVQSHLSYTVTDTASFTWFQPSAGRIYFQIWTDEGPPYNNIQFAIGADQKTPSFSLRGRTPFADMQSPVGIDVIDTLYNSNGERIGIVESYREYDQGRYSLDVMIIPDSTQYHWRLITKGSGKFDLWNYTYSTALPSGIVSSGLPSEFDFPEIVNYKYPDNNQSMVSGFQCSSNVITVGNYVNKSSYKDCNNNLVTDSTLISSDISINSSLGPTRDGRIKPDITATGDFVFSCAVLSLVPGYVANIPFVLAPGKKHVRGGGTSASAPVVAGIAALYLQKNPNASNMDVKNAIINCARHDKFTGNNLPNNIWGYGKIDAFSMLTNCSPEGIQQNTSNTVSIYAYPNPFTEQTTIDYDLTNIGDFSKAEIRIYNLLGKLIKTIPLQEKNRSITLFKEEMQNGIYFYSLSVDGKILETKKMVIL